MSTTSDSPLLRVYVWSLPRTMGTALIKCLSYVDGIQIVYEPFVSAYHYGPEGPAANPDLTTFSETASANRVEFANAFDDSKCTYGWVKQTLEANYPGKEILLAKDQAYCLDAKYDMLPSGFRHAFLIRHPYKVLPSWKRMVASLINLDHDSASWSEMQKNGLAPTKPFERQFNLLKHVKDNLDPNPVVLDADDLLSNPSSILRQFCNGVGIPYTESLSEWPAGGDVMKSWKASRISLQGNLLDDEGGYWGDAMKSERFHPPKAIPKLTDLTQDFHEDATDCMTFYKQMHELRLRP